MADVLTWTMEQRFQLEERAELLRMELAEIEAQVARLEAAQAVFGQWAEETDCGGGRRPPPSPAPDPDPVRVVAGPGTGEMRLVPDRPLRVWGWRP
ncbi:hypothetical protein AB0I52_17425 [Streptomyces sp. NPDC050423]|uniref:hypothetical protein n=1 Tax=Streptomyces sp. NPDC050423 TaxID=3155402 RepID=UPI003423EEDF